MDVCECYACYLKDEEAIKESTSGGFFGGIAREVVLSGGIVFGAAIDENLQVYHTSVDDLEGLKKLYKSKYVQSKIGNAYIQVKNHLNDNRKVLFSGTPCQIAGLKSFLGKDYLNLWCIEVACHGVPSQRLFDKYISDVSNDEPITKYCFREEDNGYASNEISYVKNGIKKTVSSNNDLYAYGFNMRYFLRKSCYHCRFRASNSKADITIGDFWNIKEEHKDFYNTNGVSAVVIRTEKGLNIFNKYKNLFVYEKSLYSKIAHANPAFRTYNAENKIRNSFFEEFNNNRDLAKAYKKIESSKHICHFNIIGSYSNRLCVQKLKYKFPSVTIDWQITNSSIISMVSDKTSLIEEQKIQCSNEYRRKSVVLDVFKQLPNVMEKKLEDAWLLLDFLEERNELLLLEDDTIITNSEAFQDSNVDVLADNISCLDIPINKWQEACLKFINIIKENYSLDHVILNRLFLVEKYGDYENRTVFDNKENVQEINERLKIYYDFFENNLKGIRVIDGQIDDLKFCSELFSYGCEPFYYNMEYYDKMSLLLEKVMMESGCDL